MACAVKMVLQRTEQGIEMYFNAMKELEEEARACYEGSVHLSSNKFTEMLVLDGCFVLELFRGSAEGFSKIGYARNDPVFSIRGLMHSIQRDMVMLENQLPLFVLDRLLELQLGTHNQKGMVTHLAFGFFKPLMPTGEVLSKPDSLGDKGDGELHCLDVFRESLISSRHKRWRQSPDTQVADKRQQQLVHSVTKLKETGVIFRSKRTDRFWDIKFNYGTKSLFSNLIAFEQCHINSSNHITSYIVFMHNLLDSAQDVSYLHYSGIIEHWLGNDSEVADMFNRLCQDVIFDPRNCYLSQLSDQVQSHYSREWNVVKGFLNHKYFNKPGAVLSFCCAAILLFLTLLQSFCTVATYFKPNP